MTAVRPEALGRDDHGRLVLRLVDGSVHVGCVPVRAFPLSAPDAALSLVGADGHEVCWIDDPRALPAEWRRILDEELALREFAPRIERITAVDTFATPSTWSVDTDRGPTTLVLKAEEDIRRLGEGALLVTDGRGIGFRIADRFALDRRSRAILERFL